MSGNLRTERSTGSGANGADRGNGRRLIRSLIHELDEAIFPSSIYCECCGSLIDRSRTYSLCDDCIKQFHWITGRTCGKCGKAMPDTSKGWFCYDCMQEKHFFRKGFSCLTYGLHERELMMGLKYAGRGYLARIFGDILYDRMEAEIRSGLFSPEGESLPGDPRQDQIEAPIELVISVPVSQGRLRKRGYNQSEVMARRLVQRWQELVREEAAAGTGPVRPGEAAAGTGPVRPGEAAAEAGLERTGIVASGAGFVHSDDAVSGTGSMPIGRLFPAPVYRSDILYRTRETQMLRSLNPTERRMALQGAFAVRKSAQPLLTGKNVLLIDDIYTTGATADACSKALLEGGAKDVYLLTLASGGNRKPGQ